MWSSSNSILWIEISRICYMILPFPNYIVGKGSHESNYPHCYWYSLVKLLWTVLPLMDSAVWDPVGRPTYGKVHIVNSKPAGRVVGTATRSRGKSKNLSGVLGRMVRRVNGLGQVLYICDVTSLYSDNYRQIFKNDLRFTRHCFSI